MTGEVFTLFNAVVPWSLAVFFLSGAAATLVLFRALRHAEVGYEDESGFHYGQLDSSRSSKGSRPAKPVGATEIYSCDHSKSRENKTARHGSHLRRG